MPLRIDADGAARLADMLEEAFVAGDALGPPRPHLQALAITLERHCEQLRLAVDAFDTTSGEFKPSIMVRQTRLEAFVNASLSLERIAQAH